MPRNPFHYLYVGERVSANDFTDIFSTALVKHALPLFQPGNVVLTGANGIGKSMLFKLFEPEVRIAYQEAGKSFPVPGAGGRFIAASININTAKCNDFGNRRTAEGEHIQELMFGDFFNYWVVADILRTIAKLAANPAIATELSIAFDAPLRERLALVLGSDPVWQGYLTDVPDYGGLVAAVDRRIQLYRRYMNGNDRELDPGVAGSKTSAGAPLDAVVRALKASGVVPGDMPFYILVDQYEELATIKSADHRKADYRAVVNKVLNSRDPTISYRIGTRGYGWRDHTHIFGTDARLELERDYKLVELETLLRQSENGRTSVFADFARDVFHRRIEHAARTEGGIEPDLSPAGMFGRSLKPSEEARIITTESSESRRSILEFEESWPAALREHLLAIADENPLSARLGEAWARQKGPEQAFPGRPWEAKTYWCKERNEVALLQIAGRRQQRAVLYGESDIVALSGSNILLFLSICQMIWDFASQASRRSDRMPVLPIGPDIQTIAIIRAGRTWLDRIPTEYGRSDNRSRLVQKMGEKFAEILLTDRRMSNPGQNGISLGIEELDARPEIRSLLVEAVDFGNLVMTEHANRSGKVRRRKFYLNPLYCPIFRIPFQRTKEPLYLPVATFEGWLIEAGVIDGLASSRRLATRDDPNEPLLDLFGDEDL